MVRRPHASGVTAQTRRHQVRPSRPRPCGNRPPSHSGSRGPAHEPPRPHARPWGSWGGSVVARSPPTGPVAAESHAHPRRPGGRTLAPGGPVAARSPATGGAVIACSPLGVLWPHARPRRFCGRELACDGRCCDRVLALAVLWPRARALTLAAPRPPGPRAPLAPPRPRAPPDTPRPRAHPSRS